MGSVILNCIPDLLLYCESHFTMDWITEHDKVELNQLTFLLNFTLTHFEPFESLLDCNWSNSFPVL